jgi:hypothetical protein
MLFSKPIGNATIKVYRAPHGMCTTLKNQLNIELPALVK